MGRHGILPPITATSHKVNETPHVAVTVLAAIAFLIPVAGTAGGVAMLDLFNYAGTCAAFGFLVPYALITVAAPVYLKAIGQLQTKDFAVCAVSLLLLAIPTVGSVYPVPAAPVNSFPYLFLAYLAVGLVWILAFHRRRPAAAADIMTDLQTNHDRFFVGHTPGLKVN
jgi:amino acid transporter